MVKIAPGSRPTVNPRNEIQLFPESSRGLSGVYLSPHGVDDCSQGVEALVGQARGGQCEGPHPRIVDGFGEFHVGRRKTVGEVVFEEVADRDTEVGG